MSLAPWSDLLATAVRMGITPDAFWRMSVSEWRLIASGASGVGVMERGRLEQLAKTFPDHGEGDGGQR